MKFLGKVGNGPTSKLLNFGVDRIRIRIAAVDTGKTCLGGGMQCALSHASNYYIKLQSAVICFRLFAISNIKDNGNYGRPIWNRAGHYISILCIFFYLLFPA